MKMSVCYVSVRGMAATLEPESKFQQDQTNIPDSLSVETHLSTSFSPLLCLSVYEVMDDSSVNSVHLVRVWRSGKDIKKRVKERGGVRELERNRPYRAPPAHLVWRLKSPFNILWNRY